jgi:glycosyltransferase involved in cell wall biosynthesis
MPVHRGEQWLQATLDSISAQVVHGLELIVVDSSPDSASADIVKRFASRLPIRLHERSPLQSWQAKTNWSVAQAAAEHVCWLHQDDIWLPGRAAEARRWIETDRGAALHIAASVLIDRNHQVLGTWRCPFAFEGRIPRQEFFERLLVQNFISAPAPVFRKDAWLKSGGMDEDLWYTGDWDIWLKLGAQGPIHHHLGTSTGFRIHGSSLTVTGSRDISEFDRQMKVVLDRHLSLVDPGQRNDVRRASLASIAVNSALASASKGKWDRLASAATRLLALGPSGIRRYIRDSRIFDRLLPRLRAKLTGSF